MGGESPPSPEGLGGKCSISPSGAFQLGSSLPGSGGMLAAQSSPSPSPSPSTDVPIASPSSPGSPPGAPLTTMVPESGGDLRVRAIAADMGMKSDARRAAQKRRAVGEIMFHACKGDVGRCKRLMQQYRIEISECIDYDRRTPMHVAAAEGCVGVTEWLLEIGADVNASDRAGSTPLNEALHGGNKVCAQLIAASGGKVNEAGRLVVFRNSSHADLGQQTTSSNASQSNFLSLSNEWEMDRREVAIQQRLGEGQYGVVSRGDWRGTPVAVKAFKGSDHITEGEFQQEVSLVQGLHHPHVVQFIGACTKETPYLIVTELALGGSLADVFNMRVQPGIKRCLAIALHTARGMSYLHGRKPHPVIHRDLKPANIMICGHIEDGGTANDLIFKHGVVKVTDFGLSRSLQGFDDEDCAQLEPMSVPHGASCLASPSYEMTGETGSYRYMAPEVFKHQRYGHKVDIFAYGVIMFQLFEKRTPFEGITPVAVARMVAEKNLRPAFPDPRKTSGSGMSQTPLAMQRLIQECWHPLPERRPEFAEICSRLEAVIADLKSAKEKKKKGDAGDTGTLANFFGSLGFRTPSRR